MAGCGPRRNRPRGWPAGPLSEVNPPRPRRAMFHIRLLCEWRATGLLRCARPAGDRAAFRGLAESVGTKGVPARFRPRARDTFAILLALGRLAQKEFRISFCERRRRFAGRGALACAKARSYAARQALRGPTGASGTAKGAMYFRRKTSAERAYLQIVESRREGLS
jgi:hypothetical protein